MRILVTAGPTREPFDSVRFISNPSSGKMGFAVAAAAAARGHTVTLVAGPVGLPDPKGVRTVHVVSSAEMARACKTCFKDCDVVVMTAAVCDYRPARPARHKLAKSREPREITLVPTEDILASLGRRKTRSQVLIGFAMEDRQPRRKARAKLDRKDLDAIFLNGPANIGSDQAEVQLLVRGEKWQPWPRASKKRVADRIVRLAERLYAHAVDN